MVNTHLASSAQLSVHQDRLDKLCPYHKRVDHTLHECYVPKDTIKLIEQDHLQHAARTSQFLECGELQEVHIHLSPNTYGQTTKRSHVSPTTSTTLNGALLRQLLKPRQTSSLPTVLTTSTAHLHHHLSPRLLDDILIP
jgi:hypothetical protein